MNSLEIAAPGSSSSNLTDEEDSPPSSQQQKQQQQHHQSTTADESINAAVPAAEPVERGRFVLHLHNRDDPDDDSSVTSENNDSPSDDYDDNDSGNSSTNSNNNTMKGGTSSSSKKSPLEAPDSPKSFNSEDIFEDVDCDIEGGTSDADIERLLGPLPRRGNSGEKGNAAKVGTAAASGKTRGILEMDSIGSDDSQRRKRSSPKRGICPCCPTAVRLGPWQWFAALRGSDGSVPNVRVGHMIVVFPKCFHAWGVGIMGPHWFGPVCCLGLLTFATCYYASKAYRNIGPISAITCLVFYVVGVVSLAIVSCSDPGVVMDGKGSGKDGYANVPMNVSAGRGWRYCDLCSVYQPPDAVHCPECNVCVEGYDHHCPWMGTCIGKKNFNSFVAFNITWLIYLLYAVIWVTFVGAAFYRHEPLTAMEDASGDV